MRIPFTPGQFFDVFTHYNEAVWPMQIVLVTAALLLTVLALVSPRASRIVIAGLAALWVWMAIAYQLAFFARLSSTAYLFAATFFVEAALLVWHGVHTRRLHFALPHEASHTVVGTLLIAFALVGYPAIAYVVGQRCPATPTFGLPCPTVVFTLGLLAWCVRPVPWSVLVIPAVWALFSPSAALNFGVVGDLALLPAAILALAVILWPRRRRATVGSGGDRPLQLGF